MSEQEITLDNFRTLQREARQRALRQLINGLETTINKIEQHRDQNDDKRVSLDAAKYLSKLAGLESDNIVLSDADGGPLSIVVRKYSDKHAD